MNEAPVCRRAEVLINRRLDNECSRVESTELDQHLVACPKCRAEFRSAQGLEVLFSQLVVPDSSAAQARFKARMGELIHEKRARKPVTQLRVPVSRRKVWLPALAALLAVTVVGVVAVLMQRGPRGSETAQLAVKFDDHVSILETLNERTLQAASQTPGTELARTHDQLATDLAGAILFEGSDAKAREDAAISYIRAHTLALFPELQDGLLGKDRLPAFQVRQQSLSSVKPATSTLSLATAVSSFAVEYLEGRTSATPPFTTPKPGASLQAAFSEAALAMRESAQPLERAQILDQVAERVLAEAERNALTPAESARLQNVAALLSARGTQNQLRLASRDAREIDAQRVATLLKSDAARLEKLQGLAEKLPPQQQERVLGALAATRASNRKMQETLTPPVDQKSPNLQDSAPPAKPNDTAPQRTENSLAPKNPSAVTGTAQVPTTTPANAIPGSLPGATINPANGPVSVPNSESGQKTDANKGNGDNPQPKSPEAGKDRTLEQGKSADKGKESAPGQVKKSESADGVAPVKSLPVQAGKNEPPSGVNGKERSEAASARGGLADKAERPEAIDRPEKPERPERPERPESLDRPDRPEKVERADKPEKGGVEKPERVERPDKPEKPERPERPDVPEKPDRPDKPDKPDTPGNNGGGNGNNGGSNGGGNGTNNGGTPAGGNGGGNPNKPEKPPKPDKPKK